MPKMKVPSLRKIRTLRSIRQGLQGLQTEMASSSTYLDLYVLGRKREWLFIQKNELGKRTKEMKQQLVELEKEMAQLEERIKKERVNKSAKPEIEVKKCEKFILKY